ncbi:MAG: ribulose-phosphate 3-epimerase [Euryarchaeota archaeon]|nr:ribulose-phosphate 3-epimerase [Euryarchaeota archaeon]
MERGRVLLSPSILSADFGRLLAQVQEAEEAGADWLHVDVMDGHFVPNLTIGPPVLESLKGKVGLPLDVHLMIERPADYIKAFAAAGAAYLTVHPEADAHLHRTVQAIREAGIRPGVALNPSTPLSALECVLDDISLVLIMTVNPGFGGQKFIRSMVPKIRQAAALIGDRDIILEVDGGIGPETAPLVVGAGARALVAGNSVFRGKGTVAQNIKAIRDSLPG